MFSRSFVKSSIATRVSLLLIAASLSGCLGRSTKLGDIPPAPTSAKLDPQIREACPDLPPVADRSAAAIASADADAAIEYRRCQAKHDAAVSAFDALADAYLQLRSAITARVNGGKYGK